MMGKEREIGVKNEFMCVFFRNRCGSSTLFAWQ